jgi:hypothetical protein
MLDTFTSLLKQRPEGSTPLPILKSLEPVQVITKRTDFVQISGCREAAISRTREVRNRGFESLQSDTHREQGEPKPLYWAEYDSEIPHPGECGSDLHQAAVC